jgi:pyocin large subunit-like protein
LYQPIPGITHAKLTEDPLGTEGEMRPRPDNYNPYEDQAHSRDPTDGQDPLISTTVTLDSPIRRATGSTQNSPELF